MHLTRFFLLSFIFSTTSFVLAAESAKQALADVEAAYTAAAKEKGFL